MTVLVGTITLTISLALTSRLAAAFSNACEAIIQYKNIYHDYMIRIRINAVGETSLRGEDQSMQDAGDPLVKQGRRGTATTSSLSQPS